MKKLLFMMIALAFTAGAIAQTAPAKQGTKKMEMKSQGKVVHAMLGVKGNCDMCKARIEKAALGVAGVTTAQWDAKDKMLHLNFNSDKTNIGAISKAIAKAGHDTDKDKASDKVYNSLPSCCKYR